MVTPRRSSIILGCIIFVAAFLRLWKLGWADVINDEALIAFRSIGLIDFLFSPYQTTPWEWLSPIPGWAHLSFHDHPPVIFLIQHIFFLLFGVHGWVLRLPVALAGIASVYFVYLIGRLISSERAGLIAAALLAVSSYHVWISRIGLQEALVIALWLFALYLFLRDKNNSRSWQWGIVFGLALLTKYTALFLAPVFVLILWFYGSRRLGSIHFWLGFVVAGIVWSPVWLYNIFLYHATGHFDLQFSYLFGQHVEEWQYLPGKIEIGSFTDRLINIVPALCQGLLIPQFLLFVIAIVLGGWWFFKNRTDWRSDCGRGLATIWLSVLFLLALLLVIGPTLRFTAMVTPLVAIVVALAISSLRPQFSLLLIIPILIIELFYTVNTIFIITPVGVELVTYSRVHYDSQRWGYSDLNQYIENITTDHWPKVTFPTRYEFLENIKNYAINNAKEKEYTPLSVLMVYDDELYGTAALWSLHRQMIYGGWPIISRSDFVKYEESYWRDSGITQIYYIHALDSLNLREVMSIDTSLSATLAPSVEPEKIILPDGRAVFEVYSW